eukprot:comp54406_c0_seq1/m.47752 comp54406_c0_seq1/g.47752  ORF comp54406_c0_seq1/g.47752 comp54406_c0_seq1/m.47752 type:complete len:835 (-) comp54406_c0_seq1:99-2603(-)
MACFEGRKRAGVNREEEVAPNPARLAQFYARFIRGESLAAHTTFAAQFPHQTGGQTQGFYPVFPSLPQPIPSSAPSHPTRTTHSSSTPAPKPGVYSHTPKQAYSQPQQTINRAFSVPRHVENAPAGGSFKAPTYQPPLAHRLGVQATRPPKILPSTQAVSVPRLAAKSIAPVTQPVNNPSPMPVNSTARVGISPEWLSKGSDSVPIQPKGACLQNSQPKTATDKLASSQTGTTRLHMAQQHSLVKAKASSTGRPIIPRPFDVKPAPLAPSSHPRQELSQPHTKPHIKPQPQPAPPQPALTQRQPQPDPAKQRPNETTQAPTRQATTPPLIPIPIHADPARNHPIPTTPPTTASLPSTTSQPSPPTPPISTTPIPTPLLPHNTPSHQLPPPIPPASVPAATPSPPHPPTKPTPPVPCAEANTDLAVATKPTLGGNDERENHSSSDSDSNTSSSDGKTSLCTSPPPGKFDEWETKRTEESQKRKSGGLASMFANKGKRVLKTAQRRESREKAQASDGETKSETEKKEEGVDGWTSLFGRAGNTPAPTPKSRIPSVVPSTTAERKPLSSVFAAPSPFTTTPKPRGSVSTETKRKSVKFTPLAGLGGSASRKRNLSEFDFEEEGGEKPSKAQRVEVEEAAPRSTFSTPVRRPPAFPSAWFSGYEQTDETEGGAGVPTEHTLSAQPAANTRPMLPFTFDASSGEESDHDGDHLGLQQEISRLASLLTAKPKDTPLPSSQNSHLSFHLSDEEDDPPINEAPTLPNKEREEEGGVVSGAKNGKPQPGVKGNLGWIVFDGEGEGDEEGKENVDMRGGGVVVPAVKGGPMRATWLLQISVNCR